MQKYNLQGVTSQGEVTAVGKGWIDIQVDIEKFPSIESIYDNNTRSGKYIRKYRIVDGVCELIEEDNNQVAWHNFKNLNNNGHTRLYLSNSSMTLTGYNIGDLLGVKSKCCGRNHNAYDFCLGNDILFENVIWTRQSRGVIRCGISNIKMKNISIEKEDNDQCLATPGGGPQLGQPRDANIHNISVINMTASNTGDDSVALFNVVSGGYVSNCHIRY